MTGIFGAESLKTAYETLLTYKPDYGNVIVVADNRFVDRLKNIVPSGKVYGVPGGEECKSLAEIEKLWKHLSENGVTRHSLLIAVGGGSVTDMAGFAASCFKRGIDTAYIPTTVLGAVDAAIGGKTGINFCGLKNEIGTFHNPVAVVMVPELWNSLDDEQLASGYGEVLKTALLEGKQQTLQALMVADALAEGVKHPFSMELIRSCAEFKKNVVEKDPYDLGLRKQLNLGHTFAHALESYARRRELSLSHGHAVAIGLLAMAIMSHDITGLKAEWVDCIADALKKVYIPFSWRCDDIDELAGYMHHDKKNFSDDSIKFVLLEAPGIPTIDCNASERQIQQALELTKDYLGV